MDYLSVGRTNYFKVKDEGVFLKWLKDLGMLEPVKLATGAYCILAEDGFPSFTEDENGDLLDIEFHEQLAEHLSPGEVAVLMEVGSEGQRYHAGYALAVDSTKKSVEVNLDSIYELAAEAFNKPATEISPAEY
jgi:hypothetical protein